VVGLSGTDVYGGTAGQLQQGDTLTLTFSEPLLASSLPAHPTLTLTPGAGTTDDMLTISGVATIDLGATNSYVTASGATFAASLTSKAGVVTITVGPNTSGDHTVAFTYSHLNSGDAPLIFGDTSTPASSYDQSLARFTWWPQQGTQEWAEYDFPKARTVQSTDVFWYDDTGHMTEADIRRACREFAQKYVDLQRTDFIRLGVLGDWFHPYMTMAYDYEATIAESPSTLTVSTDSLRVQQPFLVDLATLGNNLSPATASPKAALPFLNPARLRGLISVAKQNIAADNGFELLSFAQQASALTSGNINVDANQFNPGQVGLAINANIAASSITKTGAGFVGIGGQSLNLVGTTFNLNGGGLAFSSSTGTASSVLGSAVVMAPGTVFDLSLIHI